MEALEDSKVLPEGGRKTITTAHQYPWIGIYM
jgi:hypothetical protein